MTVRPNTNRRLAAIALLGAAALTATTALVPTAQAAQADGARAYFVITTPGDTAAAKQAVTGNGGSVYAAYDQIGVLVAHATATDFATKVRAVPGIQQVGATRTSAVPAEAGGLAAKAADPRQRVNRQQNKLAKINGTPQSAQDETVRWDMQQIRADAAWKVNTGSNKVVVGILDTGVDDTHEDLKANFDAASSVSCAFGKADTRPGAWRPQTGVSGDYHGTHVAGSVAAAKNGTGVVGVAPTVKIASVRIQEGPSGLFFPENTLCGFVWAADHKMAVTNNSYYSDPWLYTCPNDPDQAAIAEGIRRATNYAESKGVLNVAAAGNENQDLANKKTDSTSPNDSTPTKRDVTNDCLSLPTELPGVVVVSALNSSKRKSSYSTFGAGKVSVAAPGGDFGGQIYSTLPGNKYGNLVGTSMASPHVAGVAALLASTHPGATPTRLRELLARQADDLACPANETRCTGTEQKNSFYGEGVVDAEEAVTPAGTRR